MAAVRVCLYYCYYLALSLDITRSRAQKLAVLLAHVVLMSVTLRLQTSVVIPVAYRGP